MGMQTWAESEINSHRIKIKCPSPGCSYHLWDQDLENLVSDDAFQRHLEHRNADYLERLKTDLKEDPEFFAWVKSNSKPCPECHIIVSRSQGCNHMRCLCGCEFCYVSGCMYKDCICGKPGRASRVDIWNPA